MHHSTALLSLALTILAAPLAARAAESPLPTPDENGAYYHWTPSEQLRAYRAMEKIYPSNTVKRGSKVAALPKAAQDLKVSYQVGGETWDTDRFMRENTAVAVMVVHKGRIVVEQYRQGFGRDQRWTSFSVAKSFTSTLLGAAIRDGKIESVDAPVTRYLPALKGSAYDGVTIRQVLNMTSGVRWSENYRDPSSDVARIRAEPSVNGSDPVVTYMARLPREAEPGSKFAYKTGETHLIGSVIRAATGSTLADYLSAKVWQPYGMEQDAAWLLNSAGQEFAGCCISATTRDYARFGVFFLGGAKIDGRSILPDGWIAAATKTTEAARRGSAGYGYQWWTEAEGVYQGRGIFGQLLLIDPARDLVVIMNSAWELPTDPDGVMRWNAYTEAVQAAVSRAKAAD